MASRARIGAFALLVFAVGACEGEWTPAAVGAPIQEEPATDLEIRLESDLVPMRPDWLPEEASGPGDVAFSEPRVFLLWYADGAAPPSKSICSGTPPAYTCSFGTSVDDCKAKVQTYLDRWYADFNIIFTFTKPTSGKYYTEVISTSGGYCGYSGGVGGVAPFMCGDAGGGTCYAFMCGSGAKTCAVIIAQEQAHLVGLEHTSSPSDLLYPSVCSSCDGFENKTNSVSSGRCSSTQNSYALMLSRLGAWPGGTKPSPFGGGGAGGSGGTGGAGGGAGGGTGGAGGGGAGGAGGGAGGAGGGAGGAGGGTGGAGGGAGGSGGGSGGAGGGAGGKGGGGGTGGTGGSGGGSGGAGGAGGGAGGAGGTGGGGGSGGRGGSGSPSRDVVGNGCAVGTGDPSGFAWLLVGLGLAVRVGSSRSPGASPRSRR